MKLNTIPEMKLVDSMFFCVIFHKNDFVLFIKMTNNFLCFFIFHFSFFSIFKWNFFTFWIFNFKNVQKINDKTPQKVTKEISENYKIFHKWKSKKEKNSIKKTQKKKNLNHEKIQKNNQRNEKDMKWRTGKWSKRDFTFSSSQKGYYSSFHHF